MKDMKILWGEMRRYWRPVTLGVVALLSIFWVILFGSPLEKPSYRDWGLRSVAYQQRFGNTIGLDELEVIKQEHDALLAEMEESFERYMGESYDVHNMDDYQQLELAEHLQTSGLLDKEAYLTAAERWGEDNIQDFYRACSHIYWFGEMEAQSDEESDMRRIIEQFQLMDEEAEAVKINDPEWGFHLTEYTKARILEDCERHEVSVIQVLGPDKTAFRDSYQTYAVLIFVIGALLVIPFLVGNRITGVQAMQFSSRRGRSILRTQLGAALSITVSVNLAVDGFFYFAYFHNGDEIYRLLDCPVNAGAGRNQLWLNLSYRQYVWLIFLKVLLLSLALTAGLFIAAYGSKNYITAAAAAVPSVTGIALLAQHIDYHMNLEYSAAWEYPVMLLVPIAAVTAATILFLRRTRQTDYLY